MVKSYSEMKSKSMKVVESGNINKKAKLLYFTSRKSNILDAIPYDLYNLNENLSFDLTQEFFTLRDITFITNNKSQFYVYRGFNFSTQLIYDNNQKAFVEKHYDKKYASSCRFSQWLSRFFSKRISFTFDDLLKLIFGIGSLVLLFIMIWTGVLLLPKR